MGFKVTDGKGFHIRFESGVTLSTQFGVGTYSAHSVQNLTDLDKMGKEKEVDWESPDAEVAMFLDNGKWITREYADEGDDVIGYVTPERWVEIAMWCANYGKGGK